MAAVRFEDYLFLLEGFYERMNPDSGGLNNVIPPPRTLYSSNILGTQFRFDRSFIYGSTLGYSSRQTYYINPNSTISDSYIVSSNYVGSVLGSFITDYEL